MRAFLLALVALLFAAGEPALAQTVSWRVSEVGGDVRILEAGRSRPATRGALLSGGAVVTTAQRARAVLVRGRDYVIVSPASRVRVPTAAQAGGNGLVQMLLDAGTSMFRIEHRATPHFAVRTPYLAAVVKGTVFTVTVGAAGASVQVTEGAVEVSTADGGAAELVRPGTIATVSAADLQRLDIQGENSRSIRSNGAPAAGAVVVPPAETGQYQGPADSQAVVVASVTEEPIALAEVTGGLVEGNAGVDLALADVRDAVRPDVGGNGGGDASGPGTAVGGGSGDETAAPGNGGAGAGNTGNTGGGDDAGVPGDDGNNGHGNDDDGDDAGNPGNGGSGNGNGGGGDDADDDNSGPGNGGGSGNSGPGNNNGGGNDADDDNSGPGNGGGSGNSGPGNNNGGGNDADDDNSGPGNGGGSGNSGPGNNNGGGNDADDDNSGPGNGGGSGNSGPGNNNGGGNDADDDNSGPGNGGGNGNSGPGNGGDDDADDDNSGPGNGGGSGGGNGDDD